MKYNASEDEVELEEEFKNQQYSQSLESAACPQPHNRRSCSSHSTFPYQTLGTLKFGTKLVDWKAIFLANQTRVNVVNKR